MKNDKSNGEVKEKGPWSIGESGVHLGNGQRIVSEQGQKQFHYPLHPELCPCTCTYMHECVSIFERMCMPKWECVCVCVWMSCMHCYMDRLGVSSIISPISSFCLISATLSELELKEMRPIRQTPREADTTLKRTLGWCLSNVHKIITIMLMIHVSDLITWREPSQLHHTYNAFAH